MVSRSALMSLIITFMFEPAKLHMDWARARGTSTLRKALDGRPAVPGSAICVLPPVGLMVPRPLCQLLVLQQPVILVGVNKPRDFAEHRQSG